MATTKVKLTYQQRVALDQIADPTQKVYWAMVPTPGDDKGQLASVRQVVQEGPNGDRNPHPPHEATCESLVRRGLVARMRDGSGQYHVTAEGERLLAELKRPKPKADPAAPKSADLRALEQVLATGAVSVKQAQPLLALGLIQQSTTRGDYCCTAKGMDILRPPVAAATPRPAGIAGPSITQIEAARARHPGMMILYRVGAEFQAIGPKLGLADRAAADEPTLVGFPHHHLEQHLRKLLAAGHRVAVCDQVEGQARKHEPPVPPPHAPPEPTPEPPKPRPVKVNYDLVPPLPPKRVCELLSAIDRDREVFGTLPRRTQQALIKRSRVNDRGELTKSGRIDLELWRIKQAGRVFPAGVTVQAVEPTGKRCPVKTCRGHVESVCGIVGTLAELVVVLPDNLAPSAAACVSTGLARLKQWGYARVTVEGAA